MQDQPLHQDEERRRIPVAPVAAVALALVILLFFFLFSSGPQRGSNQAGRLPFAAAEQAYASRITLGNFSMSRAENFVHQEVTILSGEVGNSGDRALLQIEVTVEFHDALNQVVLRETRRIPGAGTGALGPGQQRSFVLSFERLPAIWDGRTPTVRVSGLKFA
ncbi:MAG: hypothetical protein LAN84_08830 [Acidobacteriia bacterium]|nr:hypothetical protein [Terriglobia bacterium]